MVFKGFFRRLAGLFRGGEEPQGKVYETGQQPIEAGPDEIHSVWDYLEFRPNTQAWHLSSALGFDEWVDMNEIRRRIKELFGAEYKNERSLYPYLKTLTDMGLMENSSIGGRMQWRKRDLLITLSKKHPEKATVSVASAAKKKKKSETDGGE